MTTDPRSGLALIALILAIGAASFLMTPRRADAAGFFDGRGADGAAPGLWTLTLSQVTTWIFARSLLNAAVLGFYYGAPGALAYTAYYLSFITGGAIVDAIRFRHGHPSVQSFLTERFGGTGTACYNAVIAIRLLSEVFANLLVVGAIFNAAFGAQMLGGVFGAGYGDDGGLAIVLLALIGLGYSALGGLRASLRTDVMQMGVFLVVFAVALGALFLGDGFTLGACLTAGGVAGPVPGWVLLAVAALQVISYPMHDPVMMDRGFLADRRTTRLSFIHAFWISALCIFGFGLLGIQAGILAQEGEGMQAVWARMFNPWVLTAINAALVVSALSTLDSTLSSASKLVVSDMRLLPRTLGAGRAVMALFMVGGLGFVFFGSKDLFDAVAVSGTVSMFLAPVIVLSVWGGVRGVPLWSYVTAFGAAVGGAVLYFLIAAKKPSGLAALEAMGVSHKYSALLIICLAVLAIGFGAFLLGTRRSARAEA